VKSKRLIILVISLLMLLFTLGCSKKSSEPDIHEEDPIVTEETQVIPSTTGDEIIEITDNTVVLPSDTELDMIQEGNIIVSAPTDAAPDGLLRKVIGYEEQDGQIVVITEHARLEDVFERLELKISRDLKTSEIRSTEYHIDGIELNPDHKNPVVFSYDIDEIFHITEQVSMNIDGNLSLQMGYDADASILPWPFGISYVMAEGYVGHSSNLQISVNGGFSIYDRIPVVTHIFYPITLVIGGIPISFTPKVVIYLEIDAEGQASLTTSVSSSSNFLAGLEYNKPTWSAYNEKSVNFDYTPPDLSSALHARVGAGPQFELNFYGIAGPFVNCMGYMDIAANVDNDPWWVLLGGFNIDAGVKFEALGYVADYTLHDIIEHNSIIAEAEQRLVSTPTFSPAGGTYTSTQNVALSCTTSGATIRYTTNGSEPTSSSTAYSSPINVSSTTTIKAKAFKDGWTPSATESATYTITPSGTVATPTFSPAGGTYSTTQNVSISTTTPNATIRYTTNGSEPTSTSTVYSSPISVSSTTTIKAKGFRDGWTPSATASATYTIGTTPPPADFVFVQGGTFHNGTSNVTLSSFYIDKYEVTQAGYQAVMGTNPSYFPNNPNRPVERVSWFNAIEYCNRRSIQEGLTPCYSYSSYGTNPDNWPAGWNTSDANHTNVSCNWSANGYRLPTEMEWMYAAKGGNQSQGYTYSGSNTIGDVAWYYYNSSSTTHTVGTKAANELGTFDMSGNVWEWVWDINGTYPSGNQTNPTGPVSGSYRVRRGGSWRTYAGNCTVSYRYGNGATFTYNYGIGFRVLRVSP
jgi:formylglycine-generating enzyme required for sulfatase activity